jgi:hypothetical protein
MQFYCFKLLKNYIMVVQIQMGQIISFQLEFEISLLLCKMWSIFSAKRLLKDIFKSVCHFVELGLLQYIFKLLCQLA